MKRLGLALVFALTAFILASLSLSTVRAASNVDNFSIEDYQIDYYLDRAKDGRSTLKTVESIKMLFPQSNQNHGIERAIPNVYGGHSTNLEIESVGGQINQPREYRTYSSGQNTVVRIGDADKYVHGLVSYKLTYTQKDVTRYFRDTNSDEFYWDTNGTEWRVPIKSLTVHLHLPEDLRAASSGNTACYLGRSGETNQCTIKYNDGIYTVAAYGLSPGQNVTIAIGFAPGTFSPYKASLIETVLGLAILIAFLTVPLAVVLIVWFVLRYQKRSNRSSEITTIIPEYISPSDTSVTTAATISRKPQRSFSAQLIDFAVRHYIRIYETRPKSFWRQANYELEIIKDIGDLKAEEQELLRDIFPSTSIGAKLDMASMKKNYALAARLQNNPGLLKKSISGQYGLRARNEEQSRWFKRTGFVVLAASILLLSPALLIAAIVSFVCGIALQPLTDKGLALARYLKGLELYIKVAEADRLRMLQSPEGAAKVGYVVDTQDTKQLIKLYERVLPYAILFGQEKEWNKRLGDYYQTTNESPSWYSSNSAGFNAALFSSSISNFSSTAAYSNPTSSSSGGSGGGGSSGGGGGGGGGGGW